MSDFVKKIDLMKSETCRGEKDTKCSYYFYTKLINDLLEEVKMISTKGLIKDLIYGYSIFNGAKYFVENRWQNYMLKRF